MSSRCCECEGRGFARNIENARDATRLYDARERGKSYVVRHAASEVTPPACFPPTLCRRLCSARCTFIALLSSILLKMSFMDEIRKIPPVTRFLCASSLAVTLPVLLQILPIYKVVFVKEFVTQKFEVSFYVSD